MIHDTQIRQESNKFSKIFCLTIENNILYYHLKYNNKSFILQEGSYVTIQQCYKTSKFTDNHCES